MKKEVLDIHIDKELEENSSFSLVPTDGGPNPKNKNQELQFKIKNRSKEKFKRH